MTHFLDDSQSDEFQEIETTPVSTPSGLEGVDLDYDDVYTPIADTVFPDVFGMPSTDGTTTEIAQTVTGLAQQSQQGDTDIAEVLQNIGQAQPFVNVRDTASKASVFTVTPSNTGPAILVAPSSPTRRRVVLLCASSSTTFYVGFEPFTQHVSSQPGPWLQCKYIEIDASDCDVYVSNITTNAPISVLIENY